MLDLEETKVAQNKILRDKGGGRSGRINLVKEGCLAWEQENNRDV